jgi:hypothetical protein
VRRSTEMHAISEKFPGRTALRGRGAAPAGELSPGIDAGALSSPNQETSFFFLPALSSSFLPTPSYESETCRG